MVGYPPDALVVVPPFAHRREGDEVTIGHAERNVYLSIPAEGLDILNYLADGKTVGEAAALYHEKYDERPDLDDFLAALASEGFVAGPSTVEPTPVAPALAGAAEEPKPAPRRQWSFDWIPPHVAKRFCGPVVLTIAALLTAGGVVLLTRDPGLTPGPEVFLFEGGHFALLTWLTIIFTIAATAVHELAHAIAARAAGVSASLGMGNLLYTMVAQTDISGIMMAPKRQRYRAYLFGSIVDAASAAILVGVLYAGRHGILDVHPILAALLHAVFYTYVLRITFQMFFYLRTDLYYVIANMLNAKNLMADTEAFLRNIVARVFRQRHRLVDQSGIPRRERRAVRGYAVVYCIGRFFSLSVLVFFYIPILWGYLEQVILLVTGQDSRFTGLDFFTIGVIVLAIDGGGIFLWLRGLYRARKRRKAGHAWSGSIVVPPTVPPTGPTTAQRVAA
jgi:putative peptide zinc metalloprotease protein